MPNSSGTIAWVDLTISDAESIRDFYQQVVGWNPAPVDAGGYNDYNMLDADGEEKAGICHQRGSNADLPPQWLVYITVDDLAASITACEAHHGKCITEVRQGEGYRFVVIQDPAGAVCALIEQSNSINLERPLFL